MLLILYSLWRMHVESSATGGDLAQIAAQDPELAQQMSGLAQSLAPLVYGALILIAVCGCGGMILYYLSRGGHLRRYLNETPRWIIDMQAAGVTL
jgi:hypothetical protein